MSSSSASSRRPAPTGFGLSLAVVVAGPNLRGRQRRTPPWRRLQPPSLAGPPSLGFVTVAARLPLDPASGRRRQVGSTGSDPPRRHGGSPARRGLHVVHGARAPARCRVPPDPALAAGGRLPRTRHTCRGGGRGAPPSLSRHRAAPPCAVAAGATLPPATRGIAPPSAPRAATCAPGSIPSLLWCVWMNDDLTRGRWELSQRLWLLFNSVTLPSPYRGMLSGYR
ncbi:hypothetical protein U9M48_004374 [Paspalum notatum var. saurae]|uniref:Uncharacterized protein n=1 Tax=Paspalum notatum var. saurae TaxID=547442 RepID=A0AAQ3SKQ7_PASNO